MSKGRSVVVQRFTKRRQSRSKGLREAIGVARFLRSANGAGGHSFPTSQHLNWAAPLEQSIKAGLLAQQPLIKIPTIPLARALSATFFGEKDCNAFNKTQTPMTMQSVQQKPEKKISARLKKPRATYAKCRRYSRGLGSCPQERICRDRSPL